MNNRLDYIEIMDIATTQIDIQAGRQTEAATRVVKIRLILQVREHENVFKLVEQLRYDIPPRGELRNFVETFSQAGISEAELHEDIPSEWTELQIFPSEMSYGSGAS